MRELSDVPYLEQSLRQGFARVPELPDIVVYIEALEKRILGQRLDHVRIASPFLLRTAVPPLADVEGKSVIQLRRLGKRICIGLENDIWLVLHLMIAGRLHWKKRDAKLSPSPTGLCCGPKQAQKSAHRYMSWPEKQDSPLSIRAALKCWNRIWRPSLPFSLRQTTR